MAAKSHVLISIGFSLALIAPALAQPPIDGVPAVQSSAAPAKITGMVNLYRLSDMCSVTGTSNNCATVVQINNISGTRCNVGVEFYLGRDPWAPKCTVTHSSVGLGEQITFCTRNPGSPESCNDTCSPEMTAASGFGYIYSSCKGIAVQATIITKNATDTTITSARSVNLIRLQVPPTTRANQGD